MSILSCNDEVSRECTNCPVYEPNRIIHVAFVKKGTTFTTAWDVATAAERAANLLTAELECNAIIFRNVNGTKPDPTKSELPGRGKQPSQTGRTTHTVAIQDFDYIANQENGFYNALEANAGLYDFYYMTENYVFQVTDTFLKIAAFDPITDDNSTNIIGRVDVMWQQKGNPIAYAIDTDEFDGCQVLGVEFASTAGQTTTNITGNGTNEVNINISLEAAGNVIWFTPATGVTYSIVSGTLPNNLVFEDLSVTTGYARWIGGDPVSPGTTTLIVRFSNSCGSISEDITVNLIIA